jgi:hypothetical protein
MRETCFQTVFLRELHAVRFLCQSDLCRAVVEVPIGRLPDMLGEGRCPVCGADYLRPNPGPDPFRRWKAALVTLTGLKDYLRVELVLGAGGDPPAP